MSFSAPYPNREDYDSDEDYQAAVDAYDWAESLYLDELRDTMHELSDN